MTNHVLQLFADAGKGSYEKFQQLHVLNHKTLERLTELQFSLLSLGVENTVQQARALSEANDYASLLANETDIVNGYRDKFTALSRKAGEFLAQSGNEYAHLAGQYFSAGQSTHTSGTTAQKKPRARKRRPVKKAA